MEDVAAEERPRIATPLLVDPAHSPHRKERIAEIGHRVHLAELRLQQDRTEQQDAKRGQRRAGPRGPDRRVARVRGRREDPRPPLLPAGPLDAEGPDARREPPAQGEHDRRGNQRPIGVAHRQPQAADHGVEAARPRHDDGADGERQGKPVEADRYPRSQRSPASLNRGSHICRSAPSQTTRRQLILQAISHRLHFEAAAPCIHPGALLSSSRGPARWSSPARSSGSSTATSSASANRLQPGPSLGPATRERSALLRVRAAPQRAGAQRRQARDAPDRPARARALALHVGGQPPLSRRLHVVATRAGRAL